VGSKRISGRIGVGSELDWGIGVIDCGGRNDWVCRMGDYSESNRAHETSLLDLSDLPGPKDLSGISLRRLGAMWFRDRKT
ncbi:unnamed protein product, partial [Acidithrix sp. C25]